MATRTSPQTRPNRARLPAVTPPAPAPVPSKSPVLTAKSDTPKTAKTASLLSYHNMRREATKKDLDYKSLAAVLEPHFAKQGTSLSQFLWDVNLEKSFASQARSLPKLQRIDRTELAKRRSGTTTQKPPELHDIIFGRGTVVASHPGNVFFRQVMLMNKKYYLANFNRTLKPQAATFFMEQFKRVGVRFVEEDCSSTKKIVYREVEDQRVVEKFLQTLREKKVQMNSLFLPALVGTEKSSSATKKEKDSKPQPQRTKVSNSKTASRSKPVKSKSVSVAATGTVAENDSSSLLPWITDNKAASEQLEKYLGRRGTSLTNFVASATLSKDNYTTARDRGREILLQRETAKLVEIRRAQPMDVIMGLGTPINRHSGNVLFRLIMGINQGFYHSLEHRTDKNEVAQALAGRFIDAGARFLELHDDNVKGGSRYKEVDYKRVLNKFKQGLREKCLAKQGQCLVRPVVVASPPMATKTAKKRKTSQANLENEPRGAASDSGLSSAAPQTHEAPLERQSTEHRDRKHIESLLSIGHFVLHVPEHDEEKEEDHVQSRTLQEIRLAFRSDTPPRAESSNSSTSSSISNDAFPTVESLAQLYRPSPLKRFKKFKRSVVNPLPVFHSGEK